MKIEPAEHYTKEAKRLMADGLLSITDERTAITLSGHAPAFPASASNHVHRKQGPQFGP